MVAKVKSMGIRVLVVEDEPIIALDIRQQLADAGFEVLGAGNISGKRAPVYDRARMLIRSVHNRILSNESAIC
jgi:AmiR/NasT family two-component response regulator